MAKPRATNITSMPETIEDERHARMRKYVLMMGVRVACFLALIWVRGPWMLVFAAGAIFLPYFAVVVANAIQVRRTGQVERPVAQELLYPPAEWFAEHGSGGPSRTTGTDDGDDRRAP